MKQTIAFFSLLSVANVDAASVSQEVVEQWRGKPRFVEIQNEAKSLLEQSRSANDQKRRQLDQKAQALINELKSMGYQPARNLKIKPSVAKLGTSNIQFGSRTPTTRANKTAMQSAAATLPANTPRLGGNTPTGRAGQSAQRLNSSTARISQAGNTGGKATRITPSNQVAALKLPTPSAPPDLEIRLSTPRNAIEVGDKVQLRAEFKNRGGSKVAAHERFKVECDGNDCPFRQMRQSQIGKLLDAGSRATVNVKFDADNAGSFGLRLVTEYGRSNKIRLTVAEAAPKRQGVAAPKVKNNVIKSTVPSLSPGKSSKKIRRSTN